MFGNMEQKLTTTKTESIFRIFNKFNVRIIESTGIKNPDTFPGQVKIMNHRINIYII